METVTLRLPSRHGIGLIDMVKVDVFDKSLEFVSTLHDPLSHCSCGSLLGFLVDAAPFVSYLVTQLDENRVRGECFSRHIYGLYNIVSLGNTNRTSCCSC